MKLWVLVYCDEVCGVTDKEEWAVLWAQRGSGSTYLAIEATLNQIIKDPTGLDKWPDA